MLFLSSSSDFSPVHSSVFGCTEKLIRLISGSRLEMYHLGWLPSEESTTRSVGILSLVCCSIIYFTISQEIVNPGYYVLSFTPDMGSLALPRADLFTTFLGIGDGDDVRDHVEINPRDVRDDTEEYEADTSARETIKVGIDLMSALIVEEEIVEPFFFGYAVGEDSSDSSGTMDGIVRSFETCR
ncbi:hypothetical protein Tco_0475569 [Tanacetum coccineum]